MNFVTLPTLHARPSLMTEKGFMTTLYIIEKLGWALFGFQI
jgi:hypothetical protein